MNKLSNSWEIAKQSWAVLCANPSLAIFPVVSGIGTLLVSIPFLVPLFALGMAKQNQHSEVLGPVGYLVTFLMYTATYAVVIFCNAALVTCAYQNLRGQPTTPREGFQNAMRHIPSILGWAVISATVGQVIKAFQERGGILGAVVGAVAGMAWNLIVFFVVPVMVLEGKNPIDAVKESAERLKRTWGEQLILNGGMGLVTLVFVVLPLIALATAAGFSFAGGLVPLGVALLAGGILYVIAATVVVHCLTTIYQTALYVWSTTGVLPTGFTPDTIQYAFVAKTPYPRGFGR